MEGKGRACQVDGCGKNQGAGTQVVWLEESRVDLDGQVSMGPVVEGLEHRGKRPRLDSLDSGSHSRFLRKDIA